VRFNSLPLAILSILVFFAAYMENPAPEDIAAQAPSTVISTAHETSRFQNAMRHPSVAFCILTHVLALLLHVLLFIAWRLNSFDRFTFDLGKPSDIVSTMIAILLQAIATVRIWITHRATRSSFTCIQLLTILMVLTTQRVSLRFQLERKTTLTATHDLSDAWSGLGAASLGLMAQTRIPSHPFHIGIVFLYLLSISVLHITSPALLKLQALTLTESVNINTGGIVDYFNAPYPYPGELAPDTAPDLFFLNISLPGLYHNFVYNIPDDNNATGSLDVKAYRFQVICDPMDGLTFSFDSSLNIHSESSEISLPDFNSNVSIYGKATFRFSSSTKPCLISCLDLMGIKLWGSTSQTNEQLVLTFLSIQDADGAPIPSNDIPAIANNTFHPYNGTSLNVLRCGLVLDLYSVTVDAQTKLPRSSSSFTLKQTLGNSSQYSPPPDSIVPTDLVSQMLADVRQFSLYPSDHSHLIPHCTILVAVSIHRI
jgi:hypothetical protein